MANDLRYYRSLRDLLGRSPVKLFVTIGQFGTDSVGGCRVRAAINPALNIRRDNLLSALR